MAKLSHDTVALVADVAQCPAPPAIMLPREGWESQLHGQTPAALLGAWYVELGGSEVGYADRLEYATLDRLPPLSPQLAVDRGPARPANVGGMPAPAAAHLGHGGQSGAHGAKGAEGSVAGCREPAGDGPGGTGEAAGRQLHGLWRVRPHIHRRCPSPGAEAGQLPVHVGQAVNSGGGP